LLFVALALLGVYSTLFGPVKYAILPQHLSLAELVGGNGLVEMGTFVAILLGTIAGDCHRRRGLACEPAHSVHGRRRAAARDQLEPVHRDVAQPQNRARERRRLALDARHLVVLVLWRDLPRAASGVYAARARR